MRETCVSWGVWWGWQAPKAEFYRALRWGLLSFPEADVSVHRAVGAETDRCGDCRLEWPPGSLPWGPTSVPDVSRGRARPLATLGQAWRSPVTLTREAWRPVGAQARLCP